MREIREREREIRERSKKNIIFLYPSNKEMRIF